jgi:amidase
MTTTISRRSFLKSTSAIATASASGLLAACSPTGTTGAASASINDSFRWSEATIADLASAMESGELTSLKLVRAYIDRIERLDWSGPQVNSIIEINPDAEGIARDLDHERQEGRWRGPLHGIPIVLKDSIATADRMETTAGSSALVGAKAPRDAGTVRRLREAGAVILGKANMSEWNAFRGWPLHGGWSARAGIGLNPYALQFSTGDSSSGSAAAVAANFAAGALGLETYGSIVMPSSLCSTVGLKPTLGLVSRSGTIPISFTRDAIGPMARTVADVAVLLGAIAGVDPLDDQTAASEQHLVGDYGSFLDLDGLRGARIGIWRRPDLWAISEDESEIISEAGQLIEDLIPLLRDLGAEVIDPVQLPDWEVATGTHTDVMFREFREGINRYLATLTNTDIRSLSDVIEFNETHPDEELRWHSQNILEDANQAPRLSDPGYAEALATSQRLGETAFNLPMEEHRLDAIFAPTFRRPWLINLLDGDNPENGNGAAGPSNAAGFPHITVPAGYLGELPIGASFMARAWEEPKLLKYAYAFEQATKVRHAPRFLGDYGVADFQPRSN